MKHHHVSSTIILLNPINFPLNPLLNPDKSHYTVKTMLPITTANGFNKPCRRCPVCTSKALRPPLFLCPKVRAPSVRTLGLNPRSLAISGTDLLEIPTIYFWPIFQAYVSEYPSKIWHYMVLTYLHFRILEFPLTWDLPMLWRISMLWQFQEGNNYNNDKPWTHEHWKYSVYKQTHF